MKYVVMRTKEGRVYDLPLEPLEDILDRVAAGDAVVAGSNVVIMDSEETGLVGVIVPSLVYDSIVRLGHYRAVTVPCYSCGKGVATHIEPDGHAYCPLCRVGGG